MNPLQSVTSARLAIVAGKGGVGKTTVTAVLARAAIRRGLRVAVVELDGKPTLDDLLPDVQVQHISATVALGEYLDSHGLSRVAKRLTSSGIIDVVATASPGIDDIVVLGSGPAGEGAAMMAAKNQRKVAVVERHERVGGGCTHWGTIPSKALRHAVKTLNDARANPLLREAVAPLGIRRGEPGSKAKHSEVAQFYGAVQAAKTLPERAKVPDAPRPPAPPAPSGFDDLEDF